MAIMEAGSWVDNRTIEGNLDICEGPRPIRSKLGSLITHPTTDAATLYPRSGSASRTRTSEGQTCPLQDENGCFVCLLDDSISQEPLGPSRAQMEMSDVQAAQRHVHTG